MQWLQTMYVARFNRYRNEHGHLFEGRYKAIAVEPGESLGRVCHYIDLCPVRAGVVAVDLMESFRFRSFARLIQRRGNSGGRGSGDASCRVSWHD